MSMALSHAESAAVALIEKPKDRKRAIECKQEETGAPRSVYVNGQIEMLTLLPLLNPCFDVSAVWDDK